MTEFDKLKNFILSDKMKEIKNYCCYEGLVAECEKLEKEQLKNLGVIADVRERLLALLEEAKEPTVGVGRTEYTIDGWRLHDLIKGFANAL